MFTRTNTIILCTILFLICISNSNTIIDDGLSPTVKFYLNSSNHDCFFLVGSKSGPTERIGSVKIVLSAHGEPFRKLLQDNEVYSPNGIELLDIELPDIEPKTFKDILICIYGGCDIVIKKITFEECGKMLYIAEKYSVPEVKKKLVSRLLQFSPRGLDDLFTALSNPVYFNVQELNKVLVDQLFKYTKDIFDDKRFLNLDDKALMILVKQESISVPEIIVWEAILKWGKHNTNSNNGTIVRKKISPFLEFIRFCSMNVKEFYKSVIPANVLTHEEAIELSTSLVNNKCHNISGLSNESGSRFVPQKVEQEQLIYLHYFVKNVTEIQDNQWYHSEPVKLGEFSWKINIMKNKSSLNIFIYCEQSIFYYLFNNTKVKSKSFCKCSATMDYILLNQNGNLNKEYHAVGTYMNNDLSGYKSFIEWKDLIEPSKGYIKDNHILLIARVVLNPKK